MTDDTRVCRICDGGPGNNCACSCGFQVWTQVTEEMINKALHAVVPGGAEVWCWLPQVDGFTPHQTARDVIRSALEAVIVPAPVAPVMKAAQAYADAIREQEAQYRGDKAGTGWSLAISRRQQALNILVTTAEKLPPVTP